MKPATKLISAILMLMMILMLTGCAATPSQNVENTQMPTPSQPADPTPTPNISDKDIAVGTVLLSVNPEIKISYDENGNVISLEGNNEDGKNLLQDYSDYKGKPCAEVVNVLVAMMNGRGYFSNKIAGNAKNIVIRLDDDRDDIYEDILDEIAEGIRDTVKTNNISAETVVVNRADITEKGFIGIDKAKEIILCQLGLDEADFIEKEYELDDGVYELEFTAPGENGYIEYDCDVDAITGKVLKIETEEENIVTSPNTPSNGRELIGKDKAKEIALAEKGFTAEQISYYECEFDDGVYEIEFAVNGVEYSYDINAFTGKVLKIETENVDHDNKPVTGGKELIGKAAAKEVALVHSGFDEADIVRYKCELDDGKYEIEFVADGIEYEYEINAYTGAVIKSETEKADGVPGAENLIGEERAKEIALEDSGVDASIIRGYECELDKGVYEIDFKANGIEYEYEINAYTGNIIKAESERDD